MDWLLQLLGIKKPQPVVAKTAKPKDLLLESIQKGLLDYGSPPVATQAAALAEAGRGLPDPYLPAILSLIETGGGRKITRGSNNLFNILPTRAGVDYPDYKTAILGGGSQKGLRGLLRKGGLYQDYLDSGNLSDFFTRYSPPSENASIEDQLSRYQELRSLFE